MSKRLGFSLIGIGALIAVVAILLGRSANGPTPGPGPQTSGSVEVRDMSYAYENEFLKITIPAGWSYSEVRSPGHEGAVNITKGDYILYINPATNQASGVEGGRFSEIAMGAPSVDAVLTEHPGFCGRSEKNGSAGAVGARYDVFVGSSDRSGACNAPLSGETWYFSYVSRNGGYFNEYENFKMPSGAPAQYVITMASRVTQINKLPQKGSAELDEALAEMTGILRTLELKKMAGVTLMSTQYRNEEYGFYFALPKCLSGYSIESSYWQGYAEGNSTPTENGPLVTLKDVRRAPSPQESWQDIPIMVFTIEQWNKYLTVSAAPIGPAELGRNNRYVFALPPRAIGFRDTLGVQEVSEWVQSKPLRTFNVP